MPKRKNLYLRLWVKPDQLKYDAIHWYEQSNQLFLSTFGDNADLFIDLLAATSPRLKVSANFNLTLKIYRIYRKHQYNISRLNSREEFREYKKSAKLLGDILGSLMPTHGNNVIRALQRKPLSGLKVNRFTRNLKGDLSCVTIDIWMCKAYGIKDGRITDKQYLRLERKIQNEAKQANLLPAQYQAIVWDAIRRQNGWKYVSFVTHYRKLFKEFGLHT